MKKILLDTNIILDIALERSQFQTQSSDLLKFAYYHKLAICVTATTITDIYYVLRKSKGHNNAIAFLKKFLTNTEILSIDENIILNSLNSIISDFEDAVQIETAKYSNIQTIITRNKKDFIKSKLEIYTPEEYINIMK